MESTPADRGQRRLAASGRRGRAAVVANVAIAGLLGALAIAQAAAEGRTASGAEAQSASTARDVRAGGEGTPRTPVERGAYLVHRVAMCVVCHTPRDDAGEIVEEKLLEGAPMPVESPFADREWALRTPKLAGLPVGWSEEQLSEFLQTGVTPDGDRPRPPMPPFRMTKEDASAVAAYLASLE